MIGFPNMRLRRKNPFPLPIICICKWRCNYLLVLLWEYIKPLVKDMEERLKSKEKEKAGSLLLSNY